MKITLIQIAKNFLAKTPSIVILAMLVIGTVRFAQNRSPEWSPAVDSIANWAHGYAGEVPVELHLNQQGLLDTVTLGAHSETRAYIVRIERAGFFDRWDSLTLQQVIDLPVDAVSGATFSSVAIIDNVRAEAARLGSLTGVESDSFSVDWWVKQIALWVVFAFAVVCYFRPKQTRKLRWLLMVLSIGVLGFWQGAFLSIQLVCNYIVHGSTMLQISLTAILVVSFLAPILFNKAFYCAFLCPFGMLQDAAAKLPVRKVRFSPRVFKIFSVVRRIIFVVVVLLIWFAPDFFRADQWEPFGAFVNFTAYGAIAVAGVSIIASIFIPRLWCLSLCPMGELLDTVRRKVIFKK